MRRTVIFVVVLAWASAGVPPAEARSARADVLLRKIAFHRTKTWRWQTLMGVSRTPSSGLAWRRREVRLRARVLRRWRREAARVWLRVRRPPHRAAWLCIHGGEGAWNSNTGNGYYGGLQMDRGFQRTYAPLFLLRKGTADRWSPLEQIWVAVRAHRSGRGFYPWPNTARACGLI